MKISYERLNQIIEEEVVRFKKLNEAGEVMTPAQKLDLVKKKVAALTADKISTIDQILSIVGTGQ